MMCAKNHVNIVGSFLDIWQNAEYPVFWTTRYTGRDVCKNRLNILDSCLDIRENSEFPRLY